MQWRIRLQHVMTCAAALLLISTPVRAQANGPPPEPHVTVPELCSPDSAAVFLAFAVRETRAARVFATSPGERLALLELGTRAR